MYSRKNIDTQIIKHDQIDTIISNIDYLQIFSIIYAHFHLTCLMDTLKIPNHSANLYTIKSL